MSSCPSTTYTDGDYCRDCDAVTAMCGTCQYDPANCTSCLGGKFLQNPFFGVCGTTCTGTYSLYDVVNFKCVSSCIDNLIYYAGSCPSCPSSTDGNCNLCANGTYKYIGDQSCYGICPSTYYANQARRFCEKCDITCKECDGGYPENCTSCQASSNYKYLLISRMCVAKCPSGFYANDNTTSCELCLPQLNCATCMVVAGGSGVVQCITCQYGYFMQTDNTCRTTCLPLYFKNNWRNTCDPCNANCGNCTSSAASSCLDCRAGKVFLANVSGKYCLGTCPSEYYYRSGDNCLDCYTACKTCQGTTSVDCLTCIDGLYLSNGMCRYVCPSGSYPRKSTGLC